MPKKWSQERPVVWAWVDPAEVGGHGAEPQGVITLGSLRGPVEDGCDGGEQNDVVSLVGGFPFVLFRGDRRLEGRLS